jgi:methylated-DNA-[protein]-cysteine S-methyltransferase
MNKKYYSLIETNIGICSLSFTEDSLINFSLPSKNLKEIEQKYKALSAKLCEKPPSWITDLTTKIKNHFSGKPQNFKNVPLNTETFTEFTKSVYDAARHIPPGKTCSYQEIAKKIGRPKASRAVGTALGKNPFLLIVPCHRVITSTGKLGGFSAFGGIEMKQKILEIENCYL